MRHAQEPDHTDPLPNAGGGDRRNRHAMFQAVIFDLDGTLVDTAPDVHKCANLTLQKFGMRTISLEEAKRSIGPGPDNFARIVLPEDQRHRYNEFIGVFRIFYDRHCLDSTRPFPGVRETLEQLTESAGVPLAVASNKPKVYTMRILEALDLARFFRVVLGPEDAPRLKPAPDMLLAASAALGISPSRALMVGDTDNDILAARSAGMLVCAVTWGYSTRQELALHAPDFLIDRPQELLQVCRLVPLSEDDDREARALSASPEALLPSGKAKG
ncbi:MAG: HAD-IA family hydrolase [candidate division KSB1 bacterium]|nr:HAD-IA family hydrolase [candidate division KSB1 bacterium]